MALEPIKIWELVDRAVCHKWSVPEFQRGFVWKATQVRDLAESLWLTSRSAVCSFGTAIPIKRSA
jgi:hypothetical protein